MLETLKMVPNVVTHSVHYSPIFLDLFTILLLFFIWGSVHCLFQKWTLQPWEYLTTSSPHPKHWLWATTNFCGRKTRFIVRGTEKILEIWVMNEWLHTLRGLVISSTTRSTIFSFSLIFFCYFLPVDFYIRECFLDPGNISNISTKSKHHPSIFLNFSAILLLSFI